MRKRRGMICVGAEHHNLKEIIPAQASVSPDKQNKREAMIT